MRIALLRTKETPRADYILECFRAGAAQHGDTCNWLNENDDPVAFDVAVQICMVNWRADGTIVNAYRRHVWGRFKAAGRRVLVIDTAFVRNSNDYTTACLRDRKLPVFDSGQVKTYAAVDTRIYYEMAYDGIKGRGDHCCAALMPGDRWKKLGITLTPWHFGGSYILLLTQPLYGQSSQDVNIYDWYATTVGLIRRRTALPIVARAHPRLYTHGKPGKRLNAYRKAMASALRGRELRWSVNPALRDDLVSARLAVAYSTNAVVLAAMMGVPIYVGSDACMAKPIAEHDLTVAIRKPQKPDRTAWANSLAYGQWHLGEMRSGEAWTHYRPHVHGGSASG